MPLYKLKLKLFCQSVWMQPYGMMSSTRSHTSATPLSPMGFSISASINDGPSVLPYRCHPVDCQSCDHLLRHWLAWAFSWAFHRQVLRITWEFDIEETLIMLFPNLFLCILIQQRATVDIHHYLQVSLPRHPDCHVSFAWSDDLHLLILDLFSYEQPSQPHSWHGSLHGWTHAWLS